MEDGGLYVQPEPLNSKPALMTFASCPAAVLAASRVGYKAVVGCKSQPAGPISVTIAGALPCSFLHDPAPHHCGVTLAVGRLEPPESISGKIPIG